MKTKAAFTTLFSRKYLRTSIRLCRIKSTVIFVAAVLCFLFSSPYMGFSDASAVEPVNQKCIIDIIDEAEVTADRVYLKDIARIIAADELAAELAKVDLGLSPNPGRERRLSGKRIAAVIQLSPHVPDNATIKTPENVRIIRVFQVISEKILEKVYTEKISEVLLDEDFEITKFRIRGKTRLPMGEVRYVIEDPPNDKLTGWTNLKMDVFINGKKEEMLTLSAFINRFITVLCAKNNISNKRLITIEDLTTRKINAAKAPVNLVEKISDVMGKRAKSTIKIGDLIRSNVLEVPPLVIRGNRVRLVAKKGFLEVTTIGEAKRNGCLGEEIPVMNLKSRKIVTGRVVERGTVHVFF